MILKFETGKGENRDIFHGLLLYSTGTLPSANSTRILKNRVRKRTANRFTRTNSRFSSGGDEFCDYGFGSSIDTFISFSKVPKAVMIRGLKQANDAA